MAPALAGSAAMDELVRDAGVNAPHRFSDASRAQIRKDFGRDLTGVNLRTDVAGATRARSLGAHAVTLGQDIHFAQGRLERHTEPGRTLIAHELVHALQAAPVAAGAGPLRVVGHATGGIPLRDGAKSETVLLQGDPVPADAEVDDIVVWFYINTALKNNGDSVWGAFGDLQDARHAPGWEQDPNLAAAEHYMFARFLSQSGMPNFFVASMAIDYGLAKELLKEYGIDPSFSDKPTSKSSTKQIDYGIRGAFEGGWIQKAIDWVFD